jgi:SAM-dependent methyltransferase
VTVAEGASTEQLGLPADYYRRILEVERSNWWHRGMRDIASALLGDRLARGGRLLDAGCGTGGVLAWLRGAGPFGSLAGADIAGEAIEFARGQVPEADLRVAPLDAMGWDDASFDLVVCNDVLQHVPSARLGASVSELARVIAPGGALLVRTGGARATRSERDDWRIFDADGLRSALHAGGLAVERITYANGAGSLAAAARGASPKAPSHESSGIPVGGRSRARDPRYLALRAEAAWLAGGEDRAIPYGHTLLALATPK